MTKWICLVLCLLLVAPIASARAEGPANQDDPSRECHKAVGPLLRKSRRLTPEVRNAYLDWAEKTVLEQLRQHDQAVSPASVAEVRGDRTMRTAVFGSVFPPDPSVLQNYAELRAQLGETVPAKYRSLMVAAAVAKRVKGVANPEEIKSVGRDYQPGFWVDESFRAPGSRAEKDFVRRIADFMKQESVSAEDLYRDAALQDRLKAALRDQKVAAGLVAEVSRSVSFGERLKAAMVLLGQRPGKRDEKPSTADWLRHLISLNEARPTSTPTIDGKRMPWPLFPAHAAPWPLLMPLARPVPLSEADYIWEAFQGRHGPDRYHTYGPFRGDEDVMDHSLKPSRWFWDAWPDRIVHGGMCIPLSKGTVDLYSALGKPAVWAGQPGHSNLISFQHVGGAWTAEIEQAFAGGPEVTFAQWYFDEDARTQLRFRDDYNWAGAEYHLGLAVGMNDGLASYMDTRLAAHLFRALPAAERQTLGIPLLRDALRANPYNPEVWYRLAKQTSDPKQGLIVAEAARRGDPGVLFGSPGRASPPRGGEGGARDQYWRTVAPLVARYALLSHSPPQREADRQRVLAFLKTVPDMSAGDLAAYAEKFVESDTGADAVAYDKKLAKRGDVYGLLRMGQRYRDGDGVKPSDEMATRYLARAATQGDMAAAYLLASLSPVIPADWVTVTASSSFGADMPQRLISGAGMLGALHDNDGGATTMWHTAVGPARSAPAPGLPASPAWVRFDFKRPMNVDSLLIWNHNQANLTDRGLRKVRIYGSADGASWFPLTTPEVVQLPRAGGKPHLTPAEILNRAADRGLKAVIVAANATDGNYGGNCYGLSAVRFVPPRVKGAVPASSITVTTSSSFGADMPPRLINGVGMLGSKHDNDSGAATMWHTAVSPARSEPAPGLPASPAWVRFDFKRPTNLDALLIWNHNQANLTDRGFRKVRIYGSSDGVRWRALTSPQVFELPRASGAPLSEPVTIGNKAADQPLESVLIAAEAVDGNYGGNCYGLSAVRFIVRPPAEAVAPPSSQAGGQECVPARRLGSSSGGSGTG